MVSVTKTHAYGLAHFINDLEAARREETDAARIVERVERCLRELLKRPDFLTEEQTQLAANAPEQNHRSVLYKAADGGLSVLAVVFPEGRPTPVHDHLTWGLVGVYAGVEEERKYRRVDDGSRPDFAELVEESVNNWNVGEVTSFYPPHDIHRVLAVSSRRSVSIHVYGRDIEELDRHRFDLETGQIIPWSTRPKK